MNESSYTYQPTALTVCYAHTRSIRTYKTQPYYTLGNKFANFLNEFYNVNVLDIRHACFTLFYVYKKNVYIYKKINTSSWLKVLRNG